MLRKHWQSWIFLCKAATLSRLLRLFTSFPCNYKLRQFNTSKNNVIGKKTLLKEPFVAGGSRLVVKWECEGGCSTSWVSSPKTDRRAADNNILCSAAIYYTGATYTDIFEWAQLLNLQLCSDGAYRVWKRPWETKLPWGSSWTHCHWSFPFHQETDEEWEVQCWQGYVCL